MKNVLKLVETITKRDNLLYNIDSLIDAYNNFSSPEDGCCHDCAFGDIDSEIELMQSEIDTLNKDIITITIRYHFF